MGVHYFIIITVIAIIVVFQFVVFQDTSRKISVFSRIFAPSEGNYKYGILSSIEDEIKNADDEQLQTMLKEAGYDANDFYSLDGINEGVVLTSFNSTLAKNTLLETREFEKGISSNHFNPIFDEIKKAINDYLSNNKGSVSDFHLMKDIVDRNCDAKEDEINTQIPVPLYLGLMGTMIGILVGIGYLWISGDLSALLNAGSGKSGAKGVEALLGGVALAMISSIIGILLTTFGSMKAKNARVKTERYKHVFLSWIQVNLLPNLSNDTAQTLEKMSQNLVSFNTTFSKNTFELRETLSQVNEATKIQKQLMDAVEKLADKNISRQNLEVYNALKNSSEEIGTLAKYLNNSNDYLAAVRDLNEKLDKDDRRSKAIEKMLQFFENETTQIEQRKSIISKTVGEIDSQLEEQLRKLGEHASENVNNFYVALGKQQDALQRKLDETKVIVEELKNLSSIKESVAKFEKATAEQNRKIDKLTESIKILAETKSNPTVTPQSEHRKKRIPVVARIAIWSVSILVGLVLLAIIIANWDGVSSFVVRVFRF